MTTSGPEHASDQHSDDGAETGSHAAEGKHADGDGSGVEHAVSSVAHTAQEAINAAKPRLRGWIHTATFPAAIVAGVLLIAVGPTLASRLACAVFVVTAGLLFGISATYHRGRWTWRSTAMLRRFDHANIFLVIAGTYTPLAVTLLPTRDAEILLAIAWAGALIGVLFRVFWTDAPKWLYVPAYIALGWVAVFYMPAFWSGGGPAVVFLIIAGGVLYTAGAVVYGIRRPDPSPKYFGFHEIFHLFTVLAFTCHFIAVWLAVAPFE